MQRPAIYWRVRILKFLAILLLFVLVFFSPFLFRVLFDYFAARPMSDHPIVLVIAPHSRELKITARS